ncbi:phytanoyl-CoA dioxygenase family protein [Sphingomonas sp. G-3-2-10]|uniref:phytanoyl-CoA dioxygenase family protein n=1 Tax=Sphingomonas sp. G-3-2-10 TaxID=2728838 RepID=UPI0019D20373|nr:phytanoyl-CoA dioxygenase family protein [Sphingomonas sp. G-3-2-10]
MAHAFLRDFMRNKSDPALSAEEVDSFVRDGFVRIDEAFSEHTAEQARSILWNATGCTPDDRSSWTRPVIRLDQFGQAPFREAANTPKLHAAFDQLVGAGRWWPRDSLGTFPVRFPSEDAAGDDGWHIDVSFGYEHPDFMEWRANVSSKGRALLMLFLFSDVGADDAPTRIRVGSHFDIARQLAPAGDAGLTLRELAADGFAGSAHRREELALGKAGTVYLCHPFLVHAAQRHRGTTPRFMAQPPLMPREPVSLCRPDGDYSPVEQAILNAISG